MKYCKRALWVILTIFVLSTASAQNITFRQGDNGNSKGYQPSLIRLDKADAEGRFYSVEPDFNAFHQIKGIMVREVDINFSESRNIDIANTKGSEIVQSFKEGSKMHIILNCSEKSRFKLRHICVDLASFSIETDELIADNKLEKKEYGLHWAEFSPSGQYLGILYALVNEKNGTASVESMMFNRTMDLLWKKDMSVQAVSQIMVTDDGRMATAGFSNGVEKTDGAMLVFSITDANGIQRGQATSTYKVGELTLLNCYGNKVLATALETEFGAGWAGSFTAGSVMTVGTVYTGCATFLYDVAEGRMTNSEHYSFTKKDARVFYNASVISEITSPDVNFLAVRGQTATSNGGAVLYGRKWKETVVQGNGMTTATNYFKGMMLINVDSTGHMAWMKPFMHDNGTNGDFDEFTETDLVAYGNDLYLFTNESPNDGDSYDPENAVRRTVLKVHGAISVYIVHADGIVDKRKLTTNGTNIIASRLRRQADGLFTLITRGTKNHISEITIK